MPGVKGLPPWHTTTIAGKLKPGQEGCPDRINLLNEVGASSVPPIRQSRGFTDINDSRRFCGLSSPLDGGFGLSRFDARFTRLCGERRVRVASCVGMILEVRLFKV
jgi:hypothetical protein